MEVSAIQGSGPGSSQLSLNVRQPCFRISNRELNHDFVCLPADTYFAIAGHIYVTRAVVAIETKLLAEPACKNRLRPNYERARTVP